MPASRKDIKSPRMHRRDNSSPILADGNGIPSTYDYNSESDSSAVMSTRSGTPASVAGTDISATAATAGVFNDEQLKLRAMIPALTPAHGPESTASAILAALSLGNHRPNSHTRRKSEGHVNRPPNAFIVFRRAQVQNMPANVTQHQQRISNLTALFWRVLTHSEQNTWYSLADDIKRLHNILFPDYNFNPRNPDGSKKATVPRGGLTPERLDFAWNEAQLLIQKHTVMGDHPPAPPASSTGKITRPKAPRKGQGTRAKERREREAAEREASHQAVARAAAITTATMASNNPLSNEQLSDSDDALYLSDQFSASGYEQPSTYFTAPIEEERGSTPDHESAIAWRPDFSLEGSVSSRSSPSNSWSELAPPYEAATATTDSVDPLDTSYCAPRGYENQNLAGAPAIMDEYGVGQFVSSYHPTMHSYPASPIQPPHGGVAPNGSCYSDYLPPAYNATTAKNDTTTTTPGGGPFSTPVEYGAPTAATSAYPHYSGSHHAHGPMHAATVLASSEYALAHQPQHMMYHDINPSATYLDVPTYEGANAATAYTW